MNEMAIVSIGKMRGYIDECQMAYLNLEDAAFGLGFVKTDKKNGVEYKRVHVQNLKKWLLSFGLLKSENESLPEYIQEPIFYLLAMKATNAAAQKFQHKIAYDVIPAIRKRGFYGRLSRWEALDACKRHKVTPDEYYQHIKGTDYKYLPASATKEQRYRNKIARLEKELATYRQIHDVYEYTLRDLAIKAELTDYAAWEAIKRFERQGHDFEYKEMLGKTRFTHTDKMKLFQLVNQERQEMRGGVL